MAFSWQPSCVVVILFCIIHGLSHATAGSIVTDLPGFHGPLPFSLETGYVTVDEENGAEMFYYFVKSEGNPSEDPLLVWLTGGGTCSALHSLSFSTSPIQFIKKPYNDSIPLVYHQYSYTKVANVIFPDTPMGAGFSYSANPGGYEINDNIVGMQVVNFIRKYFSNPLYVGGHSCAGEMAPYIAELISEGIEAGQKSLLNFNVYSQNDLYLVYWYQGYVVGKVGTRKWYDKGFFVQFAHGMGIISDQLYL